MLIYTERHTKPEKWKTFRKKTESKCRWRFPWYGKTMYALNYFFRQNWKTPVFVQESILDWTDTKLV